MTEFFYFIAYIFEDILFVPLDLLRELQLESWLAANMVNWIFLLVGISAFIYWLRQLKKFGKEDRPYDEHSPYLG